MITERSQRWRDRRSKFIANDSVVDPREFGVEVIRCCTEAKPFVQQHHYAGTLPPTRLSVGLFRKTGVAPSRLVGVACFTQPMNNAAIPKHTGLDNFRHACELGRFVVTDEVAANGETMFLSRALRALRQDKAEIEAIISYADPMIRHDADGNVRKAGHIGKFYAVMAMAYRGRATSRMETLLPNGQVFNDRDLSKIRAGETGHRYATDELLRQGAAARTFGQDPAVWLRSLYETGFLTKRRNLGNHIYAFPMTVRAKLAGKGLPTLAYPRIDHSITAGDVTALPLL